MTSALVILLLGVVAVLGLLGYSLLFGSSSTGYLRLLGLLLMGGSLAGLLYALLFVAGPSKLGASSPGIPYRILFVLLAVGIVIKLLAGARVF